MAFFSISGTEGGNDSKQSEENITANPRRASRRPRDRSPPRGGKMPPGGATLAKITSVTELSRSTAFRLLHYLADARLLDFDKRRRCYYVGPLTL